MTRAFARCLLPVLLAFAALASTTVRAAPVSAADTRSARAVVEGQLAAFAADDAQRAFSFAAPSIREMFGTPDRFMAMVRSGYPVVYRPATVSFLHPEWNDRELVQGVHLTDSKGSLWLAVYRLERQADASWRITGCDVQPAAGWTT